MDVVGKPYRKPAGSRAVGRRAGPLATSWARFAVATVVLFALGTRPNSARGQTAPYLVIRAPQPVVDRGPSVAARPRGIPVYKQAYAYGWFGAEPRRQVSTHHGYRQQYLLRGAE